MSPPADLTLSACGPEHGAVLAALHKTGFDSPWQPETFARLLRQPGVAGWLAQQDEPLGFILIRAAADEAEIITLAVDPGARQQGVGRRLVETAMAALTRAGAAVCHLEVAADNTAAKALYAGCGFAETGRRPHYYASGNGRTDALIMSYRLADG